MPYAEAMIARPATALSLLLLGAAPVLAQNGDRPGEEQPPLPEDLEIPPAPVLSVEEALEAFALPPGLRIECAASEPLVEDPVCIAFDGDGRMWVVEMRGYMPDVDGNGEEEPNGFVAVLEDTDGDGVYDARTNFLEDLVLPRGVLPHRDGAIVITPPELCFYRDTDGDGAADTREVLATGLGGIPSPEHAINAPRWTHDNWIQLSNHRVRFRRGPEGWLTQRTNGGGQWGLSFDEEGRAFFNTNSDPLRGDTYSSHYAVRNPNHGTTSGVNLRFARDMQVWPARITPGVNRGYRPETLRDDFTLASFTGACGPLVYLGDALGEQYRGDAFVAEPCGNLVKRYTLHAAGETGLEARQALEGREFLTSTDERFRPVELVDGPGGGLYVVDLYRGFIQHRLFVTSWLRKQVEERGLAAPLGLGRIWRVVPEDHEHAAPAPMSEASWTELVADLGHPNGWRRITAQRTIVEEGAGDPDAVELCREAAGSDPRPLGRLHALHTLAGLEALDARTLQGALGDPDQRVVRAALRAGEGVLALGGDEELVERYAHLARSGDARTAHQAALSLGEARTAAADAALVELALHEAGSKRFREALLSGVGGRELAVLDALCEREAFLVADEAELPGREALVTALARAAVRSGRSEDCEAILARAMRRFSGAPSWAQLAVAEGLLAGRPKGPKGEPRPVALAAAPELPMAFSDLPRGERIDLAFFAPLHELEDWITWPGGPNADDDPVRPLTDDEARRFERGRQVFADICAACHHLSGQGEEGLAPALRYSPWLIEDAETPLRILLGGLSGPIEVHGRTWNGEMPVFDADPGDVAAVLTYARREWGHGAEPVTVDEVRRVLAEMEQRERPWTAAELEAARQ